MIPQHRKLTVFRLYFGKKRNKRNEFFSIIIDGVARSQNEIRILFINQIYGRVQFFRVFKTSAVNILNLNDSVSFETFRKPWNF